VGCHKAATAKRVRTEEALGLGQASRGKETRREGKQRSRSFGFGQASAVLKGEGWGEANKATKERCCCCCVAFAFASLGAPIRISSRQQASGTCHCGRLGWLACPWQLAMPWRDCFLAAAKPDVQNPIPYGHVHGYFGLVLLHQKLSQDSENLSHYQLLALQYTCLLSNLTAQTQTVVAPSHRLLFLSFFFLDTRIVRAAGPGRLKHASLSLLQKRTVEPCVYNTKHPALLPLWASF
jgi:hypothetical protein